MRKEQFESWIRALLPDITDEAMVTWIVYVDEVGRLASHLIKEPFKQRSLIKSLHKKCYLDIILSRN